jgi:hypothetical protein
LPQLVSEYKTSYQKLKEMKLEIEHLQHLLEQGRVRMTRDFEAWYIQVYQQTESPNEILENEGNSEQNSNRFESAPQSPQETIGCLLQYQVKDSRIRPTTPTYRHIMNEFQQSLPPNASFVIPPRQSETRSLSKILNNMDRVGPDDRHPRQKIDPYRKFEFSKFSARDIQDNRSQSSRSDYSQNISTSLPASSQSRNVRKDIEAFYEAREEIMNRVRPTYQ